MPSKLTFSGMETGRTPTAELCGLSGNELQTNGPEKSDMSDTDAVNSRVIDGLSIVVTHSHNSSQACLF